MPELPEAESIARALDRALKARKITKVEVFFPELRTSLEALKTAKLVGRNSSVVGAERGMRLPIWMMDGH